MCRECRQFALRRCITPCPLAAHLRRSERAVEPEQKEPILPIQPRSPKYPTTCRLLYYSTRPLVFRAFAHFPTIDLTLYLAVNNGLRGSHVLRGIYYRLGYCIPLSYNTSTPPNSKIKACYTRMIKCPRECELTYRQRANTSNPGLLIRDPAGEPSARQLYLNYQEQIVGLPA
jgi:hypothetical protein